MQVSVETINGLERKATILVPSDHFEARIDEQINRAAGDLKLPGFRPGKVPRKEVRRRFGAALRQQVANELCQSSFADAVTQEELALASQASIEIVSMEVGRDLEYIATFEVMPEIELADLATIKIRSPSVQIEEADIDATVESIRKQRVEWQPVERPAAAEDRVHVDLTERVEGAVEYQREDLALVLGEHSGFEGQKALHDALLGAVVGETRVFPITLPSDDGDGDHDHDHHDHDHDHHDHDHDHHDHDHDHDHDGSNHGAVPVDAVEPATPPSNVAAEAEPAADAAPQDDADVVDDHAGSEVAPADAVDAPTPSPVRHAIGEVTVRSIAAPHLPAVDDEFMEWFGIEAGEDRFDRFRAAVRERMDLELAAAKNKAMQREVIAALDNAHDFDVPKALVGHEYEAELKRVQQFLPDVSEQLKVACLLTAQRNVCGQLVMREIAERESVETDDERVVERIDQIADSYEESAEVRRYIYGDEEQLRKIERTVLEEQVVDLVLARAQQVVVPMSYQEAIQGLPMPPLEESPDQEPDQEEVPNEEDSLPIEESSGVDESPDYSVGEPTVESSTAPDEQTLGAPTEPPTSDVEPAPQPPAKAPKGGFLRRLFKKP